MLPIERWTESELRDEIARLGERIERISELRDERSRCALSYLSQLLRDRQDALVVLRRRRPRRLT